MTTANSYTGRTFRPISPKSTPLSIRTFANLNLLCPVIAYEGIEHIEES